MPNEPMISVEEARSRITAAVSPLSLEQVSVIDGLGRVLGEPAIARRTQPPSAVSAMDGFAVRAADVANVPVELPVVGTAPAGGAHDAPLGPGEAVRIFTGAPVPDGADAIVIQENTEIKSKSVRILEGATTGTYIRPAGLDFKSGETLIESGTRLTVRHVGLAAAMNLPWLMVHRRPRVAILATGDEVVMPGDPIGPNQIVSSNGLSLAAYVHALGGEPVLLGIAADERDSLARMAEGAIGCDLLVTTGGVSVGDHDLVQSVLADKGMEIDFWRIAMRPGKPLMFGRIGDINVLGLPGNPVSSLVSALIFLCPAMSKMQGLADTEEFTTEAVLSAPLAENDERQDYLRANIRRDGGGQLVATPFSKQDSSMMATLTAADALIIRSPHAPVRNEGDSVEIVFMPAGNLRY